MDDDPATVVADETNRALHRTIDAVRDGMESLRFNTSIARTTAPMVSALRYRGMTKLSAGSGIGNH